MPMKNDWLTADTNNSIMAQLIVNLKYQASQYTKKIELNVSDATCIQVFVIKSNVLFTDLQEHKNLADCTEMIGNLAIVCSKDEKIESKIKYTFTWAVDTVAQIKVDHCAKLETNYGLYNV